MTNETTRLSKVDVNIVDWQVIFERKPFYFGCIKSIKHGVQFPFYSKEGGQQALIFLKLAMMNLEKPIPKGEYDLAQDEIKFCSLPDEGEPNEFTQILYEIRGILPPEIFVALLRYA